MGFDDAKRPTDAATFDKAAALITGTGADAGTGAGAGTGTETADDELDRDDELPRRSIHVLIVGSALAKITRKTKMSFIF